MNPDSLPLSGASGRACPALLPCNHVGCLHPDAASHGPGTVDGLVAVTARAWRLAWPCKS